MSEFTLDTEDFELKASNRMNLLSDTLNNSLLTPMGAPNSLLDQTIQDMTSIDALINATDPISGVVDATDLAKTAERVKDVSNEGYTPVAKGKDREGGFLDIESGLSKTPSTSSIKEKQAKVTVSTEKGVKAEDKAVEAKAPSTPTKDIGGFEGFGNTVGNIIGEAIQGPKTVGDVISTLAGPYGYLTKQFFDGMVSEETPLTDIMAEITTAIDEAQTFFSDEDEASVDARAFSDLMDSQSTRDEVADFDRSIERERDRGSRDDRDRDHGTEGPGGEKSGPAGASDADTTDRSGHV